MVAPKISKLSSKTIIIWYKLPLSAMNPPITSRTITIKKQRKPIVKNDWFFLRNLIMKYAIKAEARTIKGRKAKVQ
jgi:hypothetical protein